MSSDDWEKLSNEQREALDKLRKRVGGSIEAERVVFEQSYPELRLSWYCTIDAYIGKAEYVDL